MATAKPRAKSRANMILQDDDIKEGPSDSPIIIPKGKYTWGKLIELFERKKEDAETWETFHKDFICRPWDGAYATMKVIKEMYGISFNRGERSFFGEEPPNIIDIKIGVDETVQIPWGNIEVPALGPALVTTRSFDHALYGTIMRLSVQAKKMYKEDVDVFFKAVQKFLKEHSIYKGKAIVGVEEPDFLDLREFVPEQVVYSDVALDMLGSNLWGPMEFRETYAREGISRKRAVLLFGNYGTGKTLAGQLTAEKAGRYGWTFIAAKPGDNLEDVLRTARIYMPSVVFFEDVDTSANSDGGLNDMNAILDAFDGITSKGGELMCVMTTNHVDRIHMGMLRPGRLDATIEIGALDAHGVEKLIKANVKPERLGEDIDYSAVYDAMSGYYPAFVKEAITRSMSVALYHGNGSTNYTVGTRELVTAAQSLRSQFELMQSANETTKPPVLDSAFERIVRDITTTVQNETYLKTKNGTHHLVVGADNGKR